MNEQGISHEKVLAELIVIRHVLVSLVRMNGIEKEIGDELNNIDYDDFRFAEDGVPFTPSTLLNIYVGNAASDFKGATGISRPLKD